VFSKCRGETGGVFFLTCSSFCETIISNSQFLSNSALIKGGAIHYDSSRPKFANVTF